MEREVSRPIEEALNTVQGLKEVTSTSFEGSSIVRVQFNLGVNVMEAQQDVQAKVARIRRQLPPDIDDPVIVRFDPNERPIMSIAIQSAERPLRELTDIADEIIAHAARGDSGRRRRERGRRRDAADPRPARPAAMRAYAVSPPQVMRGAAAREPGSARRARGRRGETERLVRVTGRIVDPMAFRDIVVAVRDNVPIRCRRHRHRRRRRPPSSAAPPRWYNGDPAVALDMLKISGANTVEVADAVRAALRRARPAAAARRQAARHPRRLAAHPRIADRRAAHDRARRGPHDRDHLPVPELLALDGHHRPHAADLASSRRSSSCGCSASP